MPTYEYACRSCGEHLEVVQSFRDDPLTTCPSCEGDLKKVFSAAGIIFKGSGWHIKDYASSGSSSGAAASGGDSSSDSSDGGKEGGSSTKDAGSTKDSGSSKDAGSSKDSGSSSSGSSSTAESA